jgi:hypothetical protein
MAKLTNAEKLVNEQMLGSSSNGPPITPRVRHDIGKPALTQRAAALPNGCRPAPASAGNPGFAYQWVTLRTRR